MAAKSPSIERPTLEYFSFRGQHRVATGRLDPAGLPGLIFTPVQGKDLPVVVLAHGWMQPAERYSDTLRFLASWGIVAIAPDTERGPVPSPGSLAQDVRTAVDLVAASRLGGGRVTVDAANYGVIGHSIGGGAAVLAAAADPGIGAVVTVTAAATVPSAVEAAARVRVPGLHLVGSDDTMADGDGTAIAAAWAGPCQLRTVKGASHLGLSEGTDWTSTLSGSGNEKKIQQITRALGAAFLLRHLTGQDQLADEIEGKVKGTSLEDLGKVRADLAEQAIDGPRPSVDLRK